MLFDWLLVSHNPITGTPILAASSTAFLSGHGSQTTMTFGSVNVLKLGLVKIPGGYLPVITFIPVKAESFLRAFQPFSRLLTTRISFGS